MVGHAPLPGEAGRCQPAKSPSLAKQWMDAASALRTLRRRRVSLQSLGGELTVKMIAGHYWRMPRTPFVVLGAGQAFDQRIVVGVMKKADREPFCADRDVDRWIDDAMQGRHPAIIGPAGHHVANVDNERASGRADRQSLARFALHLQADGAKSGFNMVIVPKSVWAPARSWPGLGGVSWCG